MNRPKLDKPTMHEWKTDDEKISKLLQHLEEKVLNVQKWKFRMRAGNQYYHYSELLKDVNVPILHMSPSIIEMLQDAFLYLPQKFDIIKEELYMVLRKITANKEEQINFINAQEEYIDQLEQQLQEKDVTYETDNGNKYTFDSSGFIYIWRKDDKNPSITCTMKGLVDEFVQKLDDKLEEYPEETEEETPEPEVAEETKEPEQAKQPGYKPKREY